MQQQVTGRDGRDERDGRDGQQQPERSTTYIAHAEPELRSGPVRARWLETVVNPRPMGDSIDKSDLLISDTPIDELLGRNHADTTSGHETESTSSAENPATLMHDARNMVSAIDIYCDLLEEPGVLTAPFRHYAGELRLVGEASRRLLEKLAVLECRTELRLHASGRDASQPISRLSPSFTDKSDSRIESFPAIGSIQNRQADRRSGVISDAALIPTPISMPDNLSRDGRRKMFQSGQPIISLAEEVQASQSLLSALVGPGITVGLSISGGRRPIAMTGDDLTRILVNLARNAAAAMAGGGHIQISLEESREYLLMSFADNGPGIPEAALETVFSPGYSTHVSFDFGPEAYSVQPRGLGLFIVRSIVTAAGGSVWAANRTGDPLSDHSKPRGPHSLEAAVELLKDNRACQGAVILIEFPRCTSPIAI
jgi:signal transduction histidine kinase